MPTRNAELSPALFFDTVNAHVRTAAIKAAIELNLFTAIGDGSATAAEIAARCEASERGTRILCDYLTIIGFLIKQDHHYRLTPETAIFLDRRSPAYLGSAIEFLLSPELTSGFKELTAAVRKGGTVMAQEGTVSAENPIWVKFARAMAAVAMVPAQQLVKLLSGDPSRKWRVLDIAAGHGMYGITFAQHHPKAEVVALDWANVLEVAKENAKAAGIGHRFSTIAGSAFEVDLGSGYDLVFLTNFLHHFDMAACEKLLRKVHAALVDGGRAVTLDFIPDEDRITPPDAAAFAMIMLGTTPSGDAYTFAEYERMFANAGFARSQFYPLPPTLEQVVISHKLGKTFSEENSP
jgi:ubiquinone/menaquinone biosynthesis C-methylase UbiE